MRQNYHQLLQPELIKSVSGLALIARVIVDGYLSGLNHSIHVGPGMEFSQYRNYEQGDDLRLMDWKMLARSDRYYIKQSEIETNISIKFIVDTSESMLHKGEKLSKIEYLRILIASLAYISNKQGDKIGLFAFNSVINSVLHSQLTTQHYNRFLQELINLKVKGKWPINTKAVQEIHNRNHKELIFFATDFYEHNNELTSFIKQLKTPRNEVVVLHILDKNEVKFDYKGIVTFEDLETKERIKVDTKSAKNKYLYALNKMIETTRNTLLSNNISYHLFRSDKDIGDTLQAFLKQRNKLV